MRKLLLATTALLVLSALPAKADVVLFNKLSSTGTLVNFNSLDSTNQIAIGSLNDNKKQTNLVDFTNLGATIFSAAQNGNDIKITNTNDLRIQVFDNTGTIVVGTDVQVFSATGTGDLKLAVTTLEPDGTSKITPFDLGNLSLTKPTFATLLATNGEVMTSLVLFDSNGMIEDFEHYRIHVAEAGVTPAIPEASSWVMMLLGFAGLGLFGMRKRNGGTFRLA